MQPDEKEAHIRSIIREVVDMNAAITEDPWAMADIVVSTWEERFPEEPIDEDDVFAEAVKLGLADEGPMEQPS